MKAKPSSEEKIFIAIAAYCDPLLIQTIESALHKAKFPDRLIFGVVEQNLPEDFLSVESLKAANQIRYFSVHSKYARGVCWARALTMSLFQGEDWFFQIDSHIIFEQDWDLTLITRANQCAGINPNFVISSYPNPFVLENGVPIPKPVTDKVLAHVVSGTSQFAEGENLTLKFSGVKVNSDLPIKGFHLGAGCIFAPGNFVHKFPYDAQLYFHGEEQSLAARLFTRGWDIFHVPGLPLYHLYEDTRPSGRPKHWDKEQNQGRIHPSSIMYWHSEKRLKDVLTGRPDLGAYGLGNQRTMQQYKQFSGIDYANKSIAEIARVGPWTVDRKITSLPTLELLAQAKARVTATAGIKGVGKVKSAPEIISQIVIISPVYLPLSKRSDLVVLAHDLRKLGLKSGIFLANLDSALIESDGYVQLASTVIDASKHLDEKEILLDRVKLDPSVLVIFPEIYTQMLQRFEQNSKGIWWLSVENALSWNPALRDSGKLAELLGLPDLIHLYANDTIGTFLEENRVVGALPLFVA